MEYNTRTRTRTRTRRGQPPSRQPQAGKQSRAELGGAGNGVIIHNVRCIQSSSGLWPGFAPAGKQNPVFASSERAVGAVGELPAVGEQRPAWPSEAGRYVRVRAATAAAAVVGVDDDGWSKIFATRARVHPEQSGGGAERIRVRGELRGFPARSPALLALLPLSVSSRKSGVLLFQSHPSQGPPWGGGPDDIHHYDHDDHDHGFVHEPVGSSISLSDHQLTRYPVGQPRSLA